MKVFFVPYMIDFQKLNPINLNFVLLIELWGLNLMVENSVGDLAFKIQFSFFKLSFVKKLLSKTTRQN